MDFSFDRSRYEDALATRKARKQPYILLAEDHKLFRQIIASIVKDRFVLHQAHDGAEALSLFQNLAPEMVFLDINMPR